MGMLFKSQWIAFLGVVLFLSSCATVRNPNLNFHLNRNDCNQGNLFNYTKADIPKNYHELAVDSLLLTHFTGKDLNVANAIGVLNLLSDYVRKTDDVKNDYSVQNQLNLIKIQQEINNKIDLASLEISSVSAELDCEEERISQIAKYLKEKEDAAETGLTVASIAAGSLSAIITGILVFRNDQSNAKDVIGVGLGLADVTIGLMILSKKKNLEFYHPRNILSEIWLNTETSTVYPPSIWYYLNYSNPGETSIRENLIESWKGLGLVGKKKSSDKQLEIYFSEGGKYTTEQLENRANMYDAVESSIKLMKQDLRSLTLSLVELK